MTNLNNLPAFDFEDYDAQTAEVAPVHDKDGLHGPVNVVLVKVGLTELRLLPEEAAEFAAAVVASALVAKGDYVGAMNAAQAGMTASLAGFAAREAYKAGEYKQPAA